jgi:hypothetical protein
MMDDAKLLSLIKQLARNLRYKGLPDLIGQIITIHSFETVYADIYNTLNLPVGITHIEKDRKYIKGALAKYGFIDLRFTVPVDELVAALNGLSVLTHLSLVYTKEQLIQFDAVLDPNEDFIDGMELEFLTDIVEDIANNSAYLLLFLKADIPELSPQENVKRFFQYMKSFPDDFFPKQFIVQDAALSNTKMAWISKHFYI